MAVVALLIWLPFCIQATPVPVSLAVIIRSVSAVETVFLFQMDGFHQNETPNDYHLVSQFLLFIFEYCPAKFYLP